MLESLLVLTPCTLVSSPKRKRWRFLSTTVWLLPKDLEKTHLRPLHKSIFVQCSFVWPLLLLVTASKALVTSSFLPARARVASNYNST